MYLVHPGPGSFILRWTGFLIYDGPGLELLIVFYYIRQEKLASSGFKKKFDLSDGLDQKPFVVRQHNLSVTVYKLVVDLG